MGGESSVNPDRPVSVIIALPKALRLPKATRVHG